MIVPLPDCPQCGRPIERDQRAMEPAEDVHIHTACHDAWKAAASRS